MQANYFFQTVLCIPVINIDLLQTATGRGCLEANCLKVYDSTAFIIELLWPAGSQDVS